jgi:signal transduction histidine kinase
MRSNTPGQRGKPDETTVLEVADNGKGFNPKAADQMGGMGMINMRERARRVSGVLTIRSNPGKGTIIKVIVPHPEVRPQEK